METCVCAIGKHLQYFADSQGLWLLRLEEALQLRLLSAALLCDFTKVAHDFQVSLDLLCKICSAAQGWISAHDPNIYLSKGLPSRRCGLSSLR